MIRLGVVGYGRRIRSMLATFARVDPRARVVAIVDPRAAELELPADARVFDDVDAMLDHAELDGVLIGTRCSLHAPLAQRVLARDLPLFLEKPVATSWAQLDALADAAARSRSPVVVSFPLRVSAMCQLAKQLLDAGTIGEIGQVQAVNNVPAYAAGYYHGWMRDEAETGGLWLQKATHDFDYVNFLVGQRPVRICAMEAKTVFRGDMPAGLRCVDCDREDCPERPQAAESWLCSFAPDTGNHDSASALLQYESGIHAVYTQNFYTRRGAVARGARLIGYRGTIEFDWYRDELLVHHHHSTRVERHTFEPLPGEGHHGGDAELARDFLNVVAGRGASRAPLAAGILSARMCLLARESCQTGAFQDVADLTPRTGPA